MNESNNMQNSNLNYDVNNNSNVINNFSNELNNNQNKNSKKMITTIIIVCAIVLIGIGIGVGIHFFTNSSKETNDMKLCNNVYLQVENYNQEKVSYNEFFENIMSDYDAYCSDEESNLCVTLKRYNTEKEGIFKYQELEDCSKYVGSVKELCETTNKMKENQNNNQKNLADANVREIKRLCDLANE